MNLCIVGNSHVAALRSAWAEGSTLAPHHVDFFAVARGVPQVAGGCLSAAGEARIHSTVGERLDLSAYDAILVSAVGDRAARNFHAHPLFSMTLPQWGGELPIVSTEVFRHCIRHCVSSFAWVSLALELAHEARATCYFQPWPLPVPAVADDPEWKLRQLHGSLVPEVLSTYFRTQHEALREILGPSGDVLPYPHENWLDAGFTPPEFATPDPWHMNASYGRLVLGQWAERLPPNGGT